MRESGEPRKVADIVNDIAAPLGLKVKTRAQRLRLYQMVHNTMIVYSAKGYARRDNSYPAHWYLTDSVGQADRDLEIAVPN